MRTSLSMVMRGRMYASRLKKTLSPIVTRARILRPGIELGVPIDDDGRMRVEQANGLVDPCVLAYFEGRGLSTTLARRCRRGYRNRRPGAGHFRPHSFVRRIMDVR